MLDDSCSYFWGGVDRNQAEVREKTNEEADEESKSLIETGINDTKPSSHEFVLPLFIRQEVRQPFDIYSAGRHVACQFASLYSGASLSEGGHPLRRTHHENSFGKPKKKSKSPLMVSPTQVMRK